ncbi:hypothetical protein COCVIDRAFT_35343 [Bipolaris victoriae FI3]|uniref:Uncharacterized protein n=1 Tax=Bipolaris victoriae (strain FI3) TaxID=930091 RepID=W7ES75_BIPV3|nr:hypothetical protein COCVIDRAFT_35343 [Bipolaris victoriae FI3]
MTVLFIDFSQRLEEYSDHRLGSLGQSMCLLDPFVGDILIAGMTHCHISIMYEWTVQAMNFACIGRCASASAPGQLDTSYRRMVLSEFFGSFEYFDHPSWIGLPRRAVMSAQVVASTPWKDHTRYFGWSGVYIALHKSSCLW